MMGFSNPAEYRTQINHTNFSYLSAIFEVMAKSVDSYEEYEHKGTEYLIIKTEDDWIYRFRRPSSAVPYTFQFRQRPNGERSFRDCYLPDAVVNFLEDSPSLDVSDMHARQKAKRRDD